MQNIKTLFLFITISWISSSYAAIYMDAVYNEKIKTVQLFPQGADMAMPILNINNNEILELHFDDLSNSPKSYYYTILQCQSNWTPTMMNQMEYIDGFMEANISDYDYSNGTKIPYVHYKLEFPNQDMSVNRSGNYALIVYENNKENPIFIKRFMVAEAKVVIDANVAYTRNLSQRDKLQEVVFRVNYKGFKIDNPQMEIKATVLQNYRWDNAKTEIKPQFVGMNELNFDFNGVLTYPSVGREFRFFDMRSLRFRGQNIRAFDIQENENEVYLLYDKPTQPNKYQMVKDLNGQYYIENLDNPYYNTGADYANVHFNFDFNGKIEDGNFYVIGAFNNWTCNENSKLYYNTLDKSYATNIQLKQGLYNYTYVYKNEITNTTDSYSTEGYYYDTENDYTILLYFTPFGERYDRLIAVKHINSIINRM
ncbi:MAG TPA: DUF5103 domain-containing protein [Chitinophagales bacterium]|jgi:hypothetical protein|nr:DUF5103 domain-containing protein [Chitinophagales bacterium]MBP6154675.1 DUF5103 domain-containing protein [Chitinophagales bacterium]HQV77482.1 DUF5103 domain-containing protein [Chitinophagales bacterium]HQW78544.1 DUF5103 domain-containing protein [Chitinophagales bacterium]HRB67521.1 DUF5103 domain-containing protein [Chitinophagales bacterium]